MEVVPQGKRLPPVPFQRRDVEEWSTLDSLTGMLEHARVQTDHWAATTCNSSHHFGKVKIIIFFILYLYTKLLYINFYFK